MEENKELKDEEILEKAETVEETETVGETAESTENEEVEEENSENTGSDDLSMIRNLKEENKKLSNELETLKDRLLRLTAEYDNYRKRTAKEKEGIYTDACTDVLKEMLPVADNLERALAVDGNVDDLKKGVEMTIKGFLNSLDKLGVEEIDTTNGFDPNLHQAISVVEDENLNSNDVAQVYQKGYKRGEKVIRYSMVTVAK
ncbi:nucleotide exchange factor GrpE [Clostridium celatum]|uniref:Protein GrpE n=1 Tax=Clostridium celatum DSM 1785 TaxID=545697 RepID=L1Q4B5_9CLOT|nr:nucleotide exchange factor GrpE [Clostridium celatum]EKY22746.1 co-chaperone GrpE [Clostridium celatum DSM 1785]MCE9653936.1 nucleotide exchange factor GrpE [Clostridium celatum]